MLQRFSVPEVAMKNEWPRFTEICHLWLPICRFVGCCRHVWFFVMAQVYIDSRGHVNHEALSCFVVVVWCCLSFGSFPYKSFLILFLWSLLLSFLYLGEQMEQAPEEAVTSFDGTFTTVRFQGFRFWHVQTLMGRNCLRSWGEMGCQLLITMCYCKLFLQLFELTDLTVWGLATMEPICLHLKFSWKLPQDSAVFWAEVAEFGDKALRLMQAAVHPFHFDCENSRTL